MAALLFLPLLIPSSAAATIRYKISLAQPDEHLFHVTMDIPKARPGIEIAIPAWNALYQIRDFGSRVRDVEGTQPDRKSDNRLAVFAIDKQTWRLGERSDNNSVAGSDTDFEVSYAIEWNDPGPFDSQLNSQHAFLNLAEVLMYLPDRRNEESIVQFANIPDGWKTAVELPASSAPDSFVAPSYDSLVDAPVEIGQFESFKFDEGGGHFRVVLNPKSWDRTTLEPELRKIVGYELRLMGGPPFSEYTFFIHIGPYADAGGGGMEHANCDAIGAGSQATAVAIAAHEFFHTWNVKRIRPQTLQPVDYTKEQWTRALWFAEGVTSTYGSFTLVRSGIWNNAQFYSDLADEIRMLQTSPARLWQSVEESSLDAWLEKYSDYNQPERSISYYNKGQILGDLLDLAIRDTTDNHRSLDDVLRMMYKDFAERGRYYDDSADIRASVEHVTGKSFAEFFRRYVSGVDEIPYDQYLDVAGLRLKETERNEAELGFSVSRAPGGGWIVSRVPVGAAAQKGGIVEGDEILLVDGKSPSWNQEYWLRGHSPGDTVTLHIRRAGREQNVTIMLGGHSVKDFAIEEIENPTPRQVRIREGLLHGTTD